ncbi:MAG: hypothetical protein ACI9JM_001161 [Halioglobus sp.]
MTLTADTCFVDHRQENFRGLLTFILFLNDLERKVVAQAIPDFDQRVNKRVIRGLNVALGPSESAI